MAKRGRDWRIEKQLGFFLRQCRRKSQPGWDPNDRQYDREVEQKLKRMPPERLDQLLREDEETEDDTITLYRPTGAKELQLVLESGWKRWPARLPGQPIFYPVANEEYATEIASKWNVAESGKGFVTRFRVRREFMEQYQLQQVGASHHVEWWIPAEHLEQLNDNIVGYIELLAEFPEP